MTDAGCTPTFLNTVVQIQALAQDIEMALLQQKELAAELVQLNTEGRDSQHVLDELFAINQLLPTARENLRRQVESVHSEYLQCIEVTRSSGIPVPKHRAEEELIVGTSPAEINQAVILISDAVNSLNSFVIDSKGRQQEISDLLNAITDEFKKAVAYSPQFSEMLHEAVQQLQLKLQLHHIDHTTLMETLTSLLSYTLQISEQLFMLSIDDLAERIVGIMDMLPIYGVQFPDEEMLNYQKLFAVLNVYSFSRNERLTKIQQITIRLMAAIQGLIANDSDTPTVDQTLLWVALQSPLNVDSGLNRGKTTKKTSKQISFEPLYLTLLEFQNVALASDQRGDLIVARDRIFTGFSQLENGLRRIFADIRERLIHEIDSSLSKIRALLEVIDPRIPIWHRLDQLQAESTQIRDEQRFEYSQRLAIAISEAELVGEILLKEFVSTGVLNDMIHAQQLGNALLQVVTHGELVDAAFWTLASDVLEGVEISLGEGDAFYDRFGYSCVTRLLERISSVGEFEPFLTMLGSNFLPHVNEPQHSVRAASLLRYPEVVNAFSYFALENQLSREIYERLDEMQREGCICLLESTEAIHLSTKTRLYWSALLFDKMDANHPSWQRIVPLILRALCDAQHYVGAYYVLQSVRDVSPSFYAVPELFDMLVPLIQQGLQAEKNGSKFLRSLSDDITVSEIAQTNARGHFLLLALRHYVAIHYDEINIGNGAWTEWQGYESEYPNLIRVLVTQLELMPKGGFGGAVVVDQSTLKEDLSRQLQEIKKDMAVRHNLKGVMLAEEIYRWYLTNYMERWYEQVSAAPSSNQESGENALTNILREIHDLIRERDLVDACPLQHNRFERSQASAREVTGSLKVILNEQLMKLIRRFDELAKMWIALYANETTIDLPLRAMNEEAQMICALSDETRFAIEHLIVPVLPYIKLEATEVWG